MKLETIKQYIEIARSEACEKALNILDNISSVEEYIELDKDQNYTAWFIEELNNSITFDDDVIEYISKSAKYSYYYARDVIKGPWAQGEDAISKSAKYSFYYARDVIKGPWTQGEDAISKSAEYSCLYAKDVIEGPWAQGEDVISESAQYYYYYAKDVIVRH